MLPYQQRHLISLCGNAGARSTPRRFEAHSECLGLVYMAGSVFPFHHCLPTSIKLPSQVLEPKLYSSHPQWSCREFFSLVTDFIFFGVFLCNWNPQAKNGGWKPTVQIHHAPDTEVIL